MRKYLHLFHLCHFLQGALVGPLGLGLLEGLGLICQAEKGDNQLANGIDINY